MCAKVITLLVFHQPDKIRFRPSRDITNTTAGRDSEHVLARAHDGADFSASCLRHLQDERLDQHRRTHRGPAMSQTPGKRLSGALNHFALPRDFGGRHVADNLPHQDVQTFCHQGANQDDWNDTQQNPRHEKPVPHAPKQPSNDARKGSKQEEDRGDDEDKPNQALTRQLRARRCVEQGIHHSEDKRDQERLIGFR